MVPSPFSLCTVRRLGPMARVENTGKRGGSVTHSRNASEAGNSPGLRTVRYALQSVCLLAYALGRVVYVLLHSLGGSVGMVQYSLLVIVYGSIGVPCPVVAICVHGRRTRRAIVMVL